MVDAGTQTEVEEIEEPDEQEAARPRVWTARQALLEELRVAELRDMLRDRHMRVTGVKEVL
eukprot:2722169-Lingulodinium_polyedra.AAC.1